MFRPFKCVVLVAGILVGVSSASGIGYVTPHAEEPASFTWPKDPRLAGYWAYPPNVRVCTDSGVRLARLENALDMWRKAGYEFGEVTVDFGSSACVGGGVLGEITILLPIQEVMDPSQIAVTRTYRDRETSVIFRAQVYVNQYAGEKLLVLEHEIGHALGWEHHAARYHLMNPGWPKIGHVMSGLGYRQYEEEMERIRAPGRD